MELPERQKITVHHARQLQSIKDRLRNRVDKRKDNREQGLVGGRSERRKRNPSALDDLQALMKIVDEIVAL